MDVMENTSTILHDIEVKGIYKNSKPLNKQAEEENNGTTLNQEVFATQRK